MNKEQQIIRTSLRGRSPKQSIQKNWIASLTLAMTKKEVETLRATSLNDEKKKMK
jgi:hypothetical protein